MDNNGFNVMDVLGSSYTPGESDELVKDLFKNNPVSGKIKAEENVNINSIPVNNETNTEKPVEETPVKEKKMWVPDTSLTKDMEELNTKPVTYTLEELSALETKPLENISDAIATQEALDQMNSMERIATNIEIAKKRHGIAKLQVPEGKYQVLVVTAASDENYKSAQEGLDMAFNMFKTTYPEFIYEWADGRVNNSLEQEEGISGVIEETRMESPFHSIKDSNMEPTEDVVGSNIAQFPSYANQSNSDEVNVVIDKTNLSDISWSEDKITKIKKARTVNLNIVEGDVIELSEIEDVGANEVDKVISQYVSKTNGITAPLPASKYRATFIGLSYPELVDLSNSQNLNTVDAEWKKWSICFDHITNQSIGPWREYKFYIDPKNNRRIELNMNNSIPPDIDPETVHVVTKFEDFLRKTSYIDLEYMLWKILCATAMEKEIITIDCTHLLKNGRPCGNSYDWVYSPNELLDINSVNPAVLEEMKVTSEVSGIEEVLKNYRTSPVVKDQVADLKSSELKLVFGHINAYRYLTEVFPMINSIELKQKENEKPDPEDASLLLKYALLTVIKGFLITNNNGKGKKKITSTDGILKILSNLNEIDSLTISKLLDIMTDPYRFIFSLKDIVCPKCKKRSIIPITNMDRLLFIVAQSLMSVQVELKSN